MKESVEQSVPPFQFSTGTLLLLTASVALLTSIGQIDRHAFGDLGTLIKGYAALINIYFWRLITTRTKTDQRMKWAYLLFIQIATLPYLYFCVDSIFNAPFGLPPSKWIGTPVWIFMIPTLSFMMFDVHDKWCEMTAFATRSAIEIVILFLVWSYVWGFIQLFILEWAWICPPPRLAT